jgi:hypothetical protein
VGLEAVPVADAPVSSSESHPSIASNTSESSPCSSSIAKRSYSNFANLSHSLLIKKIVEFHLA